MTAGFPVGYCLLKERDLSTVLHEMSNGVHLSNIKKLWAPYSGCVPEYSGVRKRVRRCGCWSCDFGAT